MSRRSDRRERPQPLVRQRLLIPLPRFDHRPLGKSPQRRIPRRRFHADWSQRPRRHSSPILPAASHSTLPASSSSPASPPRQRFPRARSRQLMVKRSCFARGQHTARSSRLSLGSNSSPVHQAIGSPTRRQPSKRPAAFRRPNDPESSSRLCLRSPTAR
jgi:hypothetical protein